MNTKKMEARETPPSTTNIEFHNTILGLIDGAKTFVAKSFDCDECGSHNTLLIEMSIESKELYCLCCAKETLEWEEPVI